MTTSWLRIFLLYAIGVLAAGQLGIVPPLVPALQRDLGLSLAGAGMTVSIVTFVGALFGLAMAVGGPAGERNRRQHEQSDEGPGWITWSMRSSGHVLTLP